jgi:hypothetical protein
MTKKVGSNYSLLNRFLSAELNFAFAALAAGGALRAFRQLRQLCPKL